MPDDKKNAASEPAKVASFITVNPAKRMDVKLTADSRIGGKHVALGTIATVDEEAGWELITAGKAVKHVAEAK